MKSISPKELAEKLRDNSVQLVDIREPYELEIASIGGTHIPMAEVLDREGELDQVKPVVIMCRTGKRSRATVEALERIKGRQNVYNLEGGIVGYADEVDSSLTKY